MKMLQLSQGDVRRYVGVASTVIGLVCYALSSSFNCLFGDWNSFKICAYTVYGSIICLAISFPKKWQDPGILHDYRTHLAFLVFISTTVYSFYLDRESNTKPDVYGLISSTAFAATALCMSKQIECAKDLMYFFCGLLVLQLMQIKPILVSVGTGFSYFLIFLRTYLDAPPNRSQIQGDMRRHVAVASTLIGVGCSAASSSINRLRSEWMNPFYICALIVFVSVSCLPIFFPKASQRLGILKYKALFQCLFYISIFVCWSYLIEKTKTKVYSFISCASLAVASLFISDLLLRLGLLCYYCVMLVNHLMWIKPLLGIVWTAGFSCFLLIIFIIHHFYPEAWWQVAIVMHRLSSALDARPQEQEEEEDGSIQNQAATLHTSHLQHSVQLHYDKHLAQAELHNDLELGLRTE